MKCPYVQDYTCDNCRYCKTEPSKKGGVENWNMLEKNTSIKKYSANKTEEINNINDLLDDLDKEFISKHEDHIVGDERTFESGLDGGLMPTSESLTRDFNRIFGTNHKNIFSQIKK